MMAKAAVFTGVGQPFEIREYPIPSPEPGAIVARVRMTTVCGSDLHTWCGRRDAPLPIILGHEAMGEIHKMGSGVKGDALGAALSEGDRITWTIMSSCGECFYCRRGMPQKCLNLLKYGHVGCDKPPHLNGGLADYIYLRPGTAVFKVPDDLSDREVAPLNCALATMVNGLEAIGVHLGERAVVQGAGMLGINAMALLRERGTGRIIALDTDSQRLGMAAQFGADVCINVGEYSSEEVLQSIRDLTDGWGADIAIEVCGVPGVLSQGLEMLRIGGRYLLVGLVYPDAYFTLDGCSIVTKMMTIKGVHNYVPRHLAEAVDFVNRTKEKYPFEKLVTHTFSLEQVDEAFEVAAKREAIRAAIVP